MFGGSGQGGVASDGPVLEMTAFELACLKHGLVNGEFDDLLEGLD